MPTSLALFVALLILLGAPAASGEPLDEILARHYQALGGLESLRAIKTLRAEGTIESLGSETSFTILRKRPMKLRIEMDMRGTKALRVYDGSNAWGVNLAIDQTEPVEMPSDSARETRHQASFDGVLVEYRGLDAKIELEGKVGEGADALWQLDVKQADGSHRSIFLGAEDYLVRRKVITTKLQGSKLVSTINLEDYREVAGVMMAHRQVTRGAQVTESETTRMSTTIPLVTITFSGFWINEEIDDAIFEMPAQPF